MSTPEPAIDPLLASHDIISLGMMADEVRRQRHGATTTFVRVVPVPADATPLPPFGAAGEIRIVGVPSSRAAAVARVQAVLAASSGVPVTGFSLADLEALAARDGVSLGAVLDDLRAAGLALVSDAPVDLLADARASLEQVSAAGLSVARLTVDRTPSADPLPLLKTVAALHGAVGSIRAFAPLPRRFNPAAPSTGFDDVKRVALARIIVDSVPSIQVDWQLYGPKLAQVALTVGADDLDAVAADDDASQGHRRSTLEEVRRNIRAAGYEPRERDARFEPMTR